MLKLVLQGYWKRALSNRFRNERKRHERDNPLAQFSKKVKTDDDNQVQKKKSEGKSTSKSMYGIKHYLPSRPEGEDDDTIKEHIQMLKKESKKERQDVKMIQELMDVTLADRREVIVNSNWTVAKVAQEYPCLFNKDEVSLV